MISGNGRIRGPLPETVEKYSEALKMYRDTDLYVKEIVRRTGVALSGFRSYLREWHRDLMLEHRGGECNGLDKSEPKETLQQGGCQQICRSHRQVESWRIYHHFHRFGVRVQSGSVPQLPA